MKGCAPANCRLLGFTTERVLCTTHQRRQRYANNYNFSAGEHKLLGGSFLSFTSELHFFEKKKQKTTRSLKMKMKNKLCSQT